MDVLTELDWTAIGAVSSALALIGLLYSLRQVGKSFKAGMINQLYGELHHVHHTFIEHPSLRPYFFHNEPLGASDGEYMRARSIAEMYLDIFEQVYILRPFAPKGLRPFLVAYIRDMCRGSSFLASYLWENRDFLYPPELVAIVEEEHRRHQNAST